MPRVKAVPKLQSLCLFAIAKNLEILGKNAEDLQILPISLLEDLFKVLEQVKVNAKCLTYLLQSRLKEFRFSRYVNTTFPIPEAVNVATRICKNLIAIDLQYCRIGVPASKLRELVRNMPKVETLDLGWTNTNDLVMCAIGTYCPNIKILNVSSTKISDLGIYKLCVDGTGGNAKSRELKLKQLHVVCTRVSIDGACIALGLLKQLTKLSFNETGDSLKTLHDKFLNINQNNTNFKFCLEYFRHQNPLSRNCLDIVTKICPNVKEVSLRSCDNQSLQLLTRLKKLRELRIYNANSGGLLFDQGVHPLLKIIGFNLVDISFYSIPNFDIRAIGYCCPNLQKLFLEDTRSYSSCFKSELNTVPFQRLQELTLLTFDSDLPLEQLMFVMTKCQFLKSFDFYCCQMFNDDTLKTIVEHNSLRCLEHIKLTDCHQLTAAAIMSLLLMDGPLKGIEMENCNSISKEDFLLLKEFVQTQNLDVEVLWRLVEYTVPM